MKNEHRLNSLLEFPQPAVIKDITSGLVKEELNIVSKSSFLINKQRLILQIEFNIPIHDDEDTFDLLVWVEVSAQDFLAKKHQFNDQSIDEVELIGVLCHDIPTWNVNKNEAIQILISKDEVDALPKGIKVIDNLGFNELLEKGINRDVLIERLAQLQHLIDDE